jgi:hypothetical protein
VSHTFDRERGRYEESTLWNQSWTLAEGAAQTSTIADVLKSAAAIGEGSLLSLRNSFRKFRSEVWLDELALAAGAANATSRSSVASGVETPGAVRCWASAAAVIVPRRCTSAGVRSFRAHQHIKRAYVKPKKDSLVLGR